MLWDDLEVSMLIFTAPIHMKMDIFGGGGIMPPHTFDEISQKKSKKGSEFEADGVCK